MPLPYKAIFIDWDDTIGDWSSVAYKAQQTLYQRFHLDRLGVSFEQWFALYHEHNNLLWEQYGRSEITKEFLQRDRFLHPLTTLSGSSNTTDTLIEQADQMGHTFLDLTNQYFSLLPDAKQMVETLSEHYPLVVVSNGFVEVQYYKLIHSGLRSCFTDVVLSEEAGVQKPNPRIFQIALQRLNQQRERYGQEQLSEKDVLMIGDGYGSDIQGAINAGIDQLWICHQPDDFHNPNRTATYKVQSLKEVPSLLIPNF
ncbi:MAG: YjjG family noncanonical pyrimidine nucleotidase [Paludibacteraceae bacterium]|nr:YjjG family noncanonical pyrimidine nucleotidase [Paludibacteraceae bacterium]